MTNTTLEIMTQVANHPSVRKLRMRQEAMRRRFVSDYGHDFMGTGDDAYDAENGKEGVNRWTPVERKQYEELTTRARKLRTILRTALTNHYAQTV